MGVPAPRRAARDPRAPGQRRDACLTLGLVVFAGAVSGPVDDYAGGLFWVHMTQHVMILTVAAPLIALGAPWRFTPRWLSSWWLRSWWSGRFEGRGVILPAAVGAWVAFAAALLAFHLPVLYDAAIRHLWVHLVEHAVFLGTAVWFWAAVFDARSFRTGPAELWRAGYVLAAAAVGWLLALVLTFAPEPLYSEYARLGSRPGGISAITDQQLAAGVMLVPGSITFLVVAGLVLVRWLGSEVPEPVAQSPKRHEEMRA